MCVCVFIINNSPHEWDSAGIRLEQGRDGDDFLSPKISGVGMGKALPASPPFQYMCDFIFL